MRKGTISWQFDQVLAWILIALGLSISFLVPDGLLLIIVAVPFFCFVPGAMLLELAVPTQFDPLVRTFAAVIVSAAIGLLTWVVIQLVMATVVLNQAVMALSVLCAILSLGIILVRSRSPGTLRPKPILDGIVVLGQSYRSSSRKNKIAVLVTLIVIVIVTTASIGVLLSVKPYRFTEFYILNDKGQAVDFTQNYVVNQSVPMKIGIVNHEGQTVNYTVEVWLVNYTMENNAVNLTQMNYYDSFNVSLESMEFNVNNPWRAEFETDYSLNFSISGNFSLMFMLFKDNFQPLPGPLPLDPTVNYNHSVAAWRIVMVVNHQIQYLSLGVHIAP